MTSLYLAVAAFLMLNLLAGLFRVLQGPTMPDRMLAAQLFCTTTVAMLLLLSEALVMPAGRDAALVFALLAALATVAFLTRGWEVRGPGSAAATGAPSPLQVDPPEF